MSTVFILLLPINFGIFSSVYEQGARVCCQYLTFIFICCIHTISLTALLLQSLRSGMEATERLSGEL